MSLLFQCMLGGGGGVGGGEAGTDSIVFSFTDLQIKRKHINPDVENCVFITWKSKTSSLMLFCWVFRLDSLGRR